MSMQAFTQVSGAAAPLMLANVDTDVIVRVERMTAENLPNMHLYAMEALRFREDGSADPNCVLNQAAFQNAPVLLAGANFGCGSSREPAVWALMALGLRCVIAPSFGDIFYSNCFQNGMLPIRLPEATIQALASQCADGASLKVDLVTRTITAPDGMAIAFDVDDRRRDSLLQGLDDIGLTLKDDPLILAWQEKDRVARPWVWLGVALPTPPGIPEGARHV